MSQQENSLPNREPIQIDLNTLFRTSFSPNFPQTPLHLCTFSKSSFQRQSNHGEFPNISSPSTNCNSEDQSTSFTAVDLFQTRFLSDSLDNFTMNRASLLNRSQERKSSRTSSRSTSPNPKESISPSTQEDFPAPASPLLIKQSLESVKAITNFNLEFTTEFYENTLKFLDEQGLRLCEDEEVREMQFKSTKKLSLTKYFSALDLTQNSGPKSAKLLGTNEVTMDLGSSMLKKRRERLLVNTESEARSDSPGSKRSLIKLENAEKSERKLERKSSPPMSRKSQFYKENGEDTNHNHNNSPHEDDIHNDIHSIHKGLDEEYEFIPRLRSAFTKINLKVVECDSGRGTSSGKSSMRVKENENALMDVSLVTDSPFRDISVEEKTSPIIFDFNEMVYQ